LNIAQYRKQTGITQAELAEKVGVSIGMISKYESGKARPSLGRALAISTATNGAVTPGDFVTEVEKGVEHAIEGEAA